MESENKISKSFIIVLVVALVLAVALSFIVQKDSANFGMNATVNGDQTELVQQEMEESQQEINALTEVSSSTELSDIEADLDFDFDEATRLDEMN